MEDLRPFLRPVLGQHARDVPSIECVTAEPLGSAEHAAPGGWVVRVVTFEEDHRVFADAALSDENGLLITARGSAHVDCGQAPEAIRAATNLAAFRAIRRLAEEGLRSAHETPEAMRARCQAR